MKNELASFNQTNLEAFKKLANLKLELKKLQEEEKVIKEKLQEAFEVLDVKSITNEYIKITRIEATSKKVINLDALKEKEPELYDDLLKDYPKTENRKAYLKFEVR